MVKWEGEKNKKWEKEEKWWKRRVVNPKVNQKLRKQSGLKSSVIWSQLR